MCRQVEHQEGVHEDVRVVRRGLVLGGGAHKAVHGEAVAHSFEAV